MNKLKKAINRIVTVLGWFFFLWIGGCAVLGGWPYEKKVVHRTSSPNGKFEAVILQHETPPLSLNRMSLSIVPKGDRPDKKDMVLVSRYIKDFDVKWLSDSELFITHPADFNIYKYMPVWPSVIHVKKTDTEIKVTLNIDYKRMLNQRVDPTVKTPVESGKVQGTAGHP